MVSQITLRFAPSLRHVWRRASRVALSSSRARSMADAVTVRTKKFITNRLLQRRQFLVEVIHPGLAGVSKSDLKEKITSMYKVADPSCILLYGFKVAFGGGRSTGFGKIYDSLPAAQKFETKYRLTRFGLAKAKNSARKQRKERKNRAKKVRGVKKAAGKK